MLSVVTDFFGRKFPFLRRLVLFKDYDLFMSWLGNAHHCHQSAKVIHKLGLDQHFEMDCLTVVTALAEYTLCNCAVIQSANIRSTQYTRSNRPNRQRIDSCRILAGVLGYPTSSLDCQKSDSTPHTVAVRTSTASHLLAVISCRFFTTTTVSTENICLQALKSFENVSHQQTFVIITPVHFN